MYCEKCGKEVPEGSTFCTECGAGVEKPPEAAASAAPPPPSPPTETPPPPPPAEGAPTPTTEPEAPPAGPPAGEAAAPPPGPPPAPAMGAVPPKKKRTGLKVGIAVLCAVILLAVVIVVLLLVIPNGNSKARDLINKGAKPMNTVTTKGGTLSDDVNSLLQNITTMTSSQYEQQADKVRAEVTATDKLLNQAKTYLDQVAGTSADQKYKTYAGIALDIIKADLALTAEINAYLDYLTQAFKDVSPGAPLSIDTISARTQEFITKVNQLSKEANDLKDKAEKYKTDHKL